MNDENPIPADSNDSGQEPKCACGYRLVVRNVIGALLLAVMLGNLVVFASPEWAASLGQYLPTSGLATGDCSRGDCSQGRCCPEMTGIGLPTSVLDSIVEEQVQQADVEESVDTEAVEQD